MLLRHLVALPLALISIACARSNVAPAPATGAPDPVAIAPPPSDSVRLVVLLVVDQLRGDYPDRFRAQLTGGLKRLHEGGAVFPNGFQDHANTETAPGHASTLSGRFPRSTGIVSNAAGVADPQAPLVGGVGPGASPFRFRGGTLTDWMRMRDPRTRALSVSGKDRGAILPLGRAQQEAYWYAAQSGTYATSTYYGDTLPDWVKRFNAREIPASYAGRTWTRLLAPEAYPEPDSVPVEAAGRGFTFPHLMPSVPADAQRAFASTPWSDETLLALALEGVAAMRLGRGPATDVLVVSLAATDYIGHAFGPESQEVHDQILRLDRALGSFLDSLGSLVDTTRVIIALTGDHGVAPLPGTTPAAGAAEGVSLTAHGRRLRAALAARGADSAAAQFFDGVLLLDRHALRAAGVNADSLVRVFAAELRADPNVYRVHTPAELARDSATDAIARRWAHAIPPDLPIELVTTLRPYALWGPVRYAQHGSPHDYDAHVPIVFYGRPFRAGRYDAFARTVDIAPTLAWVLGVTPAEPLDGRVLTDALRPR